MTFKSIQTVAVVAALFLSAILTVEASAQCCGAATTAYYQPTAYTAYSPVMYQTNRTGWYPGYFLDRIRARLWGSPSTYVAAYPSTYVASYPSAYVASYPSTHVTSYPSTHVASYPSYSAGYASSYSPCCPAVQQVTMQPACCSTCGVSGVSQASYQSGGCSSCGVGASSGSTIVVPSESVTPGTQQGGTSYENRQPELAPSEPVAPERTYRPPTNGGSQQGIHSEPDNDANDDEIESLLKGEGADSSTYFEPPKLFDLNDRTARRTIGPVRTALYQKPVTHHQVSAPRTITAERAKQDAVGWTSASN